VGQIRGSRQSLLAKGSHYKGVYNPTILYGMVLLIQQIL